MLEKTVRIGDRDVKFRSSASVPRLYRIKFKRDIFRDLAKLEKAYSKKAKDDDDLEIDDLEIFENCAWLFMRHAGEDIPDTPEKWLDGIEGVFSVYEILPVVLDLWNGNMATTSISKKK